MDWSEFLVILIVSTGTAKGPREKQRGGTTEEMLPVATHSFRRRLPRAANTQLGFYLSILGHRDWDTRGAVPFQEPGEKNEEVKSGRMSPLWPLEFLSPI